MIEGQLLGRHISEFAEILGFPIAIPDRAPEGDPDYGLARYVELPGRGCSIVIDWDDAAMCVQFHSGEAVPRYEPYRGELPRGLAFSSSRDDVRSALGPPAQCNNGGDPLPLLGRRMRPWDWFLLDGRKIHFEYRDAADGIVMVSLSLIAPAT